MIGIGIGNIFYKNLMTPEAIKLLKAGKSIEGSAKTQN